ncbi:MAG: hypothetical protein HOG73_10150 [Candidatus Marinimicrobia bacterium]|mgnify:FL=1|jgi:hypothetical protein|nr:hypothetical protein [Candidatus Neomarinimicrobiota bacterium]MBT5996069.1 hypothetical protein [Candidatus Neomarinimicrobiota bacterium]
MIKTIILRVTLIVFTLTLSACSTQLRSVRLAASVEPEVIPGKVFIPTKSVANVGDVMLTAGEYLKEASGLRLETFHVKESTTTSVKHKMKTFEFIIPAGDYRLQSRISGGNYYSSPAFFSGLKGTKVGYGGLFVPSETSEATEFYWHWRPDMLKVYQAKLTSPISGSIGESIVYLNDQEVSGPRATLTYVGVAAGQIRFAYKEFTAEGLARPAFTQEVILDYKLGGTYAYKNAQFIVEKADSTKITFTLLRPL